VIVAIEGEEVREFDDLIAYLSRHSSAGDEITLTVLRNGDEIKVPLALGERPGRLAPGAGEEGAPREAAYLGVRGLTLSPALAELMGLDEDQGGVLVQEVAANSPADRAGLRGSFRPVIVNGQRILIGGDVIVAWNGADIADADDLDTALSQAEPGDEVVLTILRGGNERELEVTLAPRPR